MDSSHPPPQHSLYPDSIPVTTEHAVYALILARIRGFFISPSSRAGLGGMSSQVCDRRHWDEHGWKGKANPGEEVKNSVKFQHSCFCLLQTHNRNDHVIVSSPPPNCDTNNRPVTNKPCLWMLIWNYSTASVSYGNFYQILILKEYVTTV